MHEENGRFLRKANPHKITFSDNVLCIDGRVIIRKTNGCFIAQVDYESSDVSDKFLVDAFNDRLKAIARLLNEGEQAKAVFAASVMSWPLFDTSIDRTSIQKWNFNPLEPRDDRGWWTNGDTVVGQSALVDVQYRGHFHDVVVDDFLQGLSSTGATVLKNVPVLGLNMILAIPDGASRPDGWVLPYFIEVKTGFDPKFTVNQDQVYPLICTGGHATSFDTRVTQLGLTPGAPFPPLDIMLVYTSGPGELFSVGNYCELIGLRPHHAP